MGREESSMGDSPRIGITHYDEFNGRFAVTPDYPDGITITV